MQLVIRIPYGGNIGAMEHHSESPETYYVHTAGLKVVTPSTPADAYALLTAAIQRSRSGDLPGAKGALLDAPGYRRYRSPPLPLDRAHVAREGRDATLIAYGPTVQTALAAAEQRRAEGASLEVDRPAQPRAAGYGYADGLGSQDAPRGGGP